MNEQQRQEALDVLDGLMAELQIFRADDRYKDFFLKNGLLADTAFQALLELHSAAMTSAEKDI